MKEQGIRQDDPEFIKAHQILVAVQQSSNFAKQRQFQAQQQAQQRQSLQQQALGSLNPNGTNGT